LKTEALEATPQTLFKFKTASEKANENKTHKYLISTNYNYVQ